MRNRARLNRALREKAHALSASRASAVEAAALEERTRIAGELHDVVAHALSAMTVQATAARRLAERDPARAEAAFATVEGTGREALTELRRLLGVLRREDEELGAGAAAEPRPRRRRSSRRSQASGLPVELPIEGEPRPLPAGVDLTAYRLVQEALRARSRRGGGPRRRDARATARPICAWRSSTTGRAVGRRLLGLRERVGGVRRQGAGGARRARGLARRRTAADRPRRRGAGTGAGDVVVRRLRRMDPRCWDWLFALVLGIGGVIEIATIDDLRRPADRQRRPDRPRRPGGAAAPQPPAGRDRHLGLGRAADGGVPHPAVGAQLARSSA